MYNEVHISDYKKNHPLRMVLFVIILLISMIAIHKIYIKIILWKEYTGKLMIKALLR